MCRDYKWTRLFVYDSQRETEIGLGRAWKLAKLGKGECYISSIHAKRLNVVPGDKIVITSGGNYIFGHIWTQGVQNFTSGAKVKPRNDAALLIPLTIKATYSQPFGKHPQWMNDVIFVERESFGDYIIDTINPNYPVAFKNFISHHSSFLENCNEVIVNLAPKIRLDTYVDTDTTVIKQKIVAFSSKVIYSLGFNQIDDELPVFNGVQDYQIFAIFLGLILNLIIFFLCYLSIMLIYSLMMISVDSRKFEMGVTRMVTKKFLFFIFTILFLIYYFYFLFFIFIF